MWRRTLDVFLDEDPFVTEGGPRFRARPCQPSFTLRRARRDPHPLAAAPRRRLDHDREADGFGRGNRLIGAADRAEMAGDGRNTRRRRELLRSDLVAHRGDRPRVRPDEDDAGTGDRLGEGRARSDRNP